MIDESRRTQLPDQVVFLVNFMVTPNGVATSVVGLARAFKELGIPVRIFCQGGADQSFLDEFEITLMRPWVQLTTDARHFESSRPVLKPLRRILSLGIFPTERALVRKLMAGLTSRSLVIGAGQECIEFIAKTGVKIPGLSVAQVHMGISSLTEDQWARTQRVREHVDMVSALTHEDAQELERLGLAPAIGVGNPCPTPSIDHMPTKKREIVFVGRLAPIKGVNDLMEAFAAADLPEWKLRIFGIGPEEENLKTLAQTLHANISLEGMTSDPISVMRDASIHALSSYAEGLPMSIIEASSQGTPTIAYTCSPGVSEALGDHGIPVNVGDKDALRDALRELAMNENEREQRAHRALADVRYEGKAIAEQWLNLWAEHQHIV